MKGMVVPPRRFEGLEEVSKPLSIGQVGLGLRSILGLLTALNQHEPGNGEGRDHEAK